MDAQTSGPAASEAWHVDDGLWASYADGRLDPVTEASVEAHVGRCAVCRGAAREQVRPAQLDAGWAALRREVRRPRPSPTARWLRRLGVPDADATVLSASDGLAVAWSLAVGVALTCAMLAGLLPTRQDEVFLLLAPLVPVLAVVAAHDATDALRTLVGTTPYSKLRLALLRTVATLAVAVPVTLAVGLAVPGLGTLAFTWLLPSLALTSTTLVALTRVGAWTASGGVGTAWVAVVLATAGLDDVSVLTGGPAQALCAALAALMTVLLVTRASDWRPAPVLGGGAR